MPYTGPGAMGVGKPLKSILHMNPDIPIYLGTGNEATVKLTAEIADGWLPLGFVPGSMPEYRPWLEEGFRRAGGGKGFAQLRHPGPGARRDRQRRQGGARQAQARGRALRRRHGPSRQELPQGDHDPRGFKAAADRIQELYLAHRKEEAAAAVPDEWVDDRSLVGPAERIKQRYRAWADSGLTGLSIRFRGPSPNPQVIEVMAEAAGLVSAARVRA